MEYGEGEGVVDAGGCFLCGQNVSDVWVDVEEETTASNDWIGCNVKPFRIYSFMTATKNDQFCDHHPLYLQKWTIDPLFKN